MGLVIINLTYIHFIVYITNTYISFTHIYIYIHIHYSGDCIRRSVVLQERKLISKFGKLSYWLLYYTILYLYIKLNYIVIRIRYTWSFLLYYVNYSIFAFIWLLCACLVGRFGIDEDAALLRYIQRRTNTTSKLSCTRWICTLSFNRLIVFWTDKPIIDIPQHNLPWMQLSSDLGTQRFTEVYRNHWSVLRHRLLYSEHGAEPDSNTSSSSSSTRKAPKLSSATVAKSKLTYTRSKSLAVLEGLCDMCRDDPELEEEYDVPWTLIDQRYGLAISESRK